MFASSAATRSIRREVGHARRRATLSACGRSRAPGEIGVSRRCKASRERIQLGDIERPLSDSWGASTTPGRPRSARTPSTGAAAAAWGGSAWGRPSVVDPNSGSAASTASASPMPR